MSNAINKNNNFAFIHIVAALMVMSGHEFILLGHNSSTILGMGYHTLGVYILFFVSGYLTAGSYLRQRNCGKYLLKRLLRIYPPLALCLVVSVFVMYMITTTPNEYWDSAFRYLCDNLSMKPNFCLAGVFLNNPYRESVNGSLWTLPVELLCYVLLIPVVEMAKIMKKATGRFYVKAILLVLVILQIAVCVINTKCPDMHIYVRGNDFWGGSAHIVLFFTGAFIQLLDLDRKVFNFQIAVIIIVIYMYLQGEVSAFLRPFVIGYAVLSMAFADNPLYSKMIKRDLCYGLYLWAFPVQQLIIYFVQGKMELPLSIYLLVSIALTWILAELQYGLVEKNVNKYIRGRL